MKVFCFYILMLCVQISFAQKTFVFPKIKTQGAYIEQFTPSNWIVIDRVYGDLNNDASDDLAVVFEFNRSIDETRVYGDNNTDIIKETQKPRILAIFFKDKSTGNYSLSTQNNDFILRSE